jgi:hypothetical protein
MRKFIFVAAMAVGLVMLWAAIVPLTAQPAPAQTAVNSAGMSRALFLCRGPNGIDSTCAAALAKALVLESNGPATVTRASDRHCRVDPQMFARLEQQD